MPGKSYVDGGSSARVSRLMREREMRKSIKASRDEPSETLVRGNAAPGNGAGARVSSGENGSGGDGVKKQDVKPAKQRLLVVANRLPVTAVRKGEDVWSLDQQSSGGLVSALLGVKDYEALWIGWAGINVADEVGQRSLTKAFAEKRCVPVFLDEETAHRYYNGYCNNILWPVLHYIGLPQEDRLSTTKSFESQYIAYKKANQMFADVINELYEEGDIVWCHDFHLMYLPKLLKEENSAMKVGWFLHSPFPSSEIHRTLPSRSELLRSALAADLLGFHTYDYARHFVSACTRILGLEGTPEGVEDQGRLARVAVFPIGIDSDRFTQALDLPQVQERIREFKERFAGRKIILGVDRLDMIKGIPQKILAFEKFLEENPEWREKVVLLQIAVPTRTDVPEYQKLKRQVHEMVGRINGRFGTLDAVPIHHLDQSLDFHGLCALYNVTDVALVTSLRDGMNLVSYEFVACQDAKKGVLILSEFAGAAQSLGAGAILVNPWNIIEVSNAIGQALDMKADEIEKRHKHNFAHVSTHTAQAWAENFMSELNDTVVEAEIRTRDAKPPLPKKEAIEHYFQANNRLLILGFNATLTEQVDTPGRRGDQIKEMDLKLHPQLRKALHKLCTDPSTTVVILSGSDRVLLDDNFGEFNMWLAAENGMFLRHTKGEWMTTMPEHLNLEWVDSVKHVFEYFTERTPRSHFELRETSLVWNYKYADVEFGRIQARDMLEHLWTGPISNASVDVVQGSYSVQVRSAGVTKGATIDRILGEIVHSKSMTEPIDYVLCIGHFLGKDEDVYTFFEPVLPVDSNTGCKALEKRSSFKVPAANMKGGFQRAPPSPEKSSLNILDLKDESYYSCSVARARTNARFHLASPEDAVSFLKQLAEISL